MANDYNKSKQERFNVTEDAIVFVREAEDFFELEGALNDVDIETPLKELDIEWKKWKHLK